MTKRLRVRSMGVGVGVGTGGAVDRIDDEGAAALAKALESGKCQLTSLDLGGALMQLGCAHVRSWWLEVGALAWCRARGEMWARCDD